MNNNQEHYNQAIEYAARDLLHKWDAISKFDNYKEALDYAINLGGGSSIYPNVGEFWFYERNKGYKITLLGHNAREVKVPVKHFLSVAERIWNREKLNQLSLF